MFATVNRIIITKTWHYLFYLRKENEPDRKKQQTIARAKLQWAVWCMQAVLHFGSPMHAPTEKRSKMHLGSWPKYWWFRVLFLIKTLKNLYRYCFISNFFWPAIFSNVSCLKGTNFTHYQLFQQIRKTNMNIVYHIPI